MKLEKADRENIIGVLEIRINYSFECLNKLTDEQLEKMYKERVLNDYKR